MTCFSLPSSSVSLPLRSLQYLSTHAPALSPISPIPSCVPSCPSCFSCCQPLCVADDERLENNDARCRKIAQLVRDCPTKQEATALSKEQGLRYSVLYQLPSYKAVGSLALDIMHITYLGIDKHVFEHLVKPKLGAIGKELDRRVKAMSRGMSSSIGRFPDGISEYWQSFRADQYRNFFKYYVEFCMVGLVSDDEYECLMALSLHNTLLEIQPMPINESGIGQVAAQYNEFFNLFKQLCPDRLVYKIHAGLHWPIVMRLHGPPIAMSVRGTERAQGRMQSKVYNSGAFNSTDKQIVR